MRICLKQVDELLMQVKSKADADDEIMAQVNYKVEEWKVKTLFFLVFSYEKLLT